MIANRWHALTEDHRGGLMAAVGAFLGALAVVPLVSGMGRDSMDAWLVALQSEVTSIESTMAPGPEPLRLWSLVVVLYLGLGAFVGLVVALWLGRVRRAGRTLAVYLALVLGLGALAALGGWAATGEPGRLVVLACVFGAMAGLARWVVIRHGLDEAA